MPPRRPQREPIEVNWDRFWNCAKATVRQASEAIDRGYLQPNVIQLHCDRFQHVLRVLRRYGFDRDDDSPARDWIERCEQLQEQLMQRLGELEADLAEAESGDDGFGIQLPVWYDYDEIGVNGGRPKYHVDTAVVTQMLREGYTINNIAKDHRVSRQTIRRRLQEDKDGIDTRIDDTELRVVIEAIREKMPAAGWSCVWGAVKEMGFIVSRDRIRVAMRHVDENDEEFGFLRELLTMPTRVQYYVPYPNAVWHIDGHHKLIKFGFVIHGGIDGFSRRIVFLDVSTNNYASTVLDRFDNACARYGVPERIRVDKGGENLLICARMYSLRRGHRSAVLSGRSVQNVRIERLWRDVFRLVVALFKAMFIRMVQKGQLDLDSDFDLYCLHVVFQPRIQRSLDCMRRMWDYHGIRTECHSTPIRLWNEGLRLLSQNSALEIDLARTDNGFLTAPVLPNPTDEVDLENYAVDPEGPPPMRGEAHEKQLKQVELDDKVLPNEISSLWTERELRNLAEELEVHKGRDLHGIDAYIRFRESLLFRLRARV